MSGTTRLASLFFIPVLVLATAALALAAGRPPLDEVTLEVVEHIKEREADLKTFEARFDQIQKSKMFQQIVQSHGIIRYDARGKLLFQITDPTPFTVVFDGDWVYIRDPGDTGQNRIKKHRIGQQENILRKYFGVGQPLEDLTRRFDVKATSNKPLPGVTLVMRPKEARLSKRVSMISADVDDGSWLPREIFIEQPQGDWTRMHLEFTTVNQPLPADAFNLAGDAMQNSPTTERKEAP